MNSNYNSYGRGGAHFGGPSSGYRMNGGYQGMRQQQAPPMMGMRGGASSFGQRGGLPYGGGRGGRAFGAPTMYRRGEFADQEPFSREMAMSPIQKAPRLYSRPGEVEIRLRSSEVSHSSLRGRSRDFSRGKESVNSRPGERSRRSRGDRKPQSPRPVSNEVRTPNEKKIPRRDQEGGRKRLNQSQRSDRARSNPDTIWIRADDSAQFYVRLAKNRFHREKLDEVKFHAAGKNSIYIAFKAVEVLSRYGYATIGMIKTSKLKKRDDDEKSISKVEIILKRTEGFEKVFEDFQKVLDAKKQESSRRPRSSSTHPDSKEKAQLPAPDQEEAKETTPKQLSEEIDSGSGEAPTSAKSQSTPEKSSTEAAGTAKTSSGKSLKEDKWWLKGVKKNELAKIEVDDEPVVYI
jgi:hypothetical protein